ncbi:MAG: RNA polymerase sigma factor, partial [Verrucomicrobiota bacterium]
MPDDSPPSMPTRASLLNRLKDWDDRTGWQEFFDAYSGLIYQVARRAGLTDDEAQEVVQETVLGVARKIGEFRADPARGSFKAWLLRQARWRIGDQFRQRGRIRRAPDLRGGGMGETTGDATDPVLRIPEPGASELEQAWEAEWRRALTARALERVKQQVSGRQFQMYDLHVVQGLPVRETARVLGVGVASVYMAKYRVGERLRRRAAS